MPDPYAVAVTMSTLWHGEEEEFSNVFHFDAPALINSEGGWESLADQVVSALRPIMASTVTFRRVRVHGPTHLSKAEDQMRLVKDLTGAGTLAVNFDIAPENCVVADLYVGRGPKGGKQFLRKYLHTCGLTAAGSSNAAQGRTSIVQAARTPFETALNSLLTVNVGGVPNQICTPNGKLPPGGNSFAVNPYVASRQFRRGRKRTRA